MKGESRARYPAARRDRVFQSTPLSDEGRINYGEDASESKNKFQSTPLSDEGRILMGPVLASVLGMVSIHAPQ